MKIAAATGACLLSAAALAAGEAPSAAAGLDPRTDAVVASSAWRSSIDKVNESALELPDRARLVALCNDAVAALPATSTPREDTDACFRRLGASGPPFVFYMSREEWRASFQPAAVGVGLAPMPEASAGLRLVAVGPSAREAGLRKGDELVAVDGRPVAGLAMDDAVALLRGDEFTAAHLSIRRGADRAPQDVTVTRRKQGPEAPVARMLGADVLYLRMAAVDARTVSTLLALAASTSESSSPRGLVLDLRGNPGGVVPELQRLAACLMPVDTPMMLVRRRTGTETLSAESPRQSGEQSPSRALGAVLKHAPLVVLVDHRTASGAEALAMALRERRGARVHGERSAGAAMLDAVVPVPSGGLFRIHQGEILSSEGVPLNGRGATVDVVAPIADDVEYGDAERDAGLQSALAALDRPARAR